MNFYRDKVADTGFASRLPVLTNEELKDNSSRFGIFRFTKKFSRPVFTQSFILRLLRLTKVKRCHYCDSHNIFYRTEVKGSRTELAFKCGDCGHTLRSVTVVNF